jgi:hypothetical protein
VIAFRITQNPIAPAPFFGIELDNVETALSQLIGDVERWRRHNIGIRFVGKHGGSALVVERYDETTIRVSLQGVPSSNSPVWLLVIYEGRLIWIEDEGGVPARFENVEKLAELLWLYYRGRVEETVLRMNINKR